MSTATKAKSKKRVKVAAPPNRAALLLTADERDELWHMAQAVAERAAKAQDKARVIRLGLLTGTSPDTSDGEYLCETLFTPLVAECEALLTTLKDVAGCGADLMEAIRVAEQATP